MMDNKQLPPRSVQKYVSGERRLCEKDISFSEEIIQDEGMLNFYMDVVFDPDKVFGTNVSTSENDDYINLYANYDMERQYICDTLEVYLECADGRELDYKYRLTAEEKTAMLPKMDAYCKHRLGISLEECCQQYREEQRQDEQQLAEPTM